MNSRQWVVRFTLIAVLIAAVAVPVAAATPKADSAILFIGDGTGPVQIRIGRAAAQVDALVMEGFPVRGYATTMSANADVTDSAAAGTALATGHKTNNGMIGVTPEGKRLTTILERAQAMYKATGIITTDALRGATPASFAAHVGSRGESAEIALQMAHSGADVMMGFWKDQFLPTSAGGKRTDGLDLIAEMQKSGYQVVYTKDELKAAHGEKLVGLFDDGAQSPTLSDMVTAALQRLSRNPHGFFLVVEGARIDWFSHANDPAGVVLAVKELDAAVMTGADAASRRGKTLVLVTADHETGGLAIADGSKLGILARITMSASDMAAKLSKERDNVGEVLQIGAGISDVTTTEADAIRSAKDPSAAIASIVSARAGLTWGTQDHTATRVRVFALGPGSERFSGDLDNTMIPKRIADAIGIGPLP